MTPSHPTGYTSGQLMIARYVLSAIVMACGASIVCFWLASTGEAGRRSHKLTLAGFVLLGASIFALGSAFLYAQTRLQVLHAIGKIVAVNPHGRQTSLLIRTPESDEVSVQAAGRSPYFELGRRVRIDYQQSSGLLLNATFLSQVGEPVGTYRGNPKWLAYFIVAGGAMLVYAGIRRYPRDPNAIEAQTVRNPDSAGAAIDDRSMLHFPSARQPGAELEE